MRRSAIQLQGMIENLLHYNKIQTQFTTLNPSQFGLAKLVKAVLDDHRLSMLAKSLRLDSHLQNVKMWGDEEKLRTVVDNLLSNAVKYSDKNGLIRLRLYPKHDNVFFEVANQGPSIDGKERERIFDLFYRGEAVERCNIRGTGVGLVVVREYVSLHNGQIELLEAAVEHGQQNIVFRVQLPVDCRRELG